MVVLFIASDGQTSQGFGVFDAQLVDFAFYLEQLGLRVHWLSAAEWVRLASFSWWRQTFAGRSSSSSSSTALRGPVGLRGVIAWVNEFVLVHVLLEVVEGRHVNADVVQLTQRSFPLGQDLFHVSVGVNLNKGDLGVALEKLLEHGGFIFGAQGLVQLPKELELDELGAFGFEQVFDLIVRERGWQIGKLEDIWRSTGQALVFRQVWVTVLTVAHAHAVAVAVAVAVRIRVQSNGRVLENIQTRRIRDGRLDSVQVNLLFVPHGVP